MEMLDINADIAKKTAEIRAKYGFKTPDAIQLASALHSGSDFFITNDNQLNKFKELKVILVDQLS
nr:PIN domain-containing protein [Marinilabilia rubra]